MTLFFTYLLIGLTIAMPVGAITVEMTKQGLKKGFLHGWAVGLGGMTVDTILIILLYMGFAAVLSIPAIQIPLWLLGAGFLAVLGYDSIKNSDKGIVFEGNNFSKTFFKSYLRGLLIAITPGNIIFWISVFGTVLTNSYNQSEKTSFLIVGAGILAGILIHDIGLLTIVSITRKVMSQTMTKWVSILAGILLFIFAGYFFYEFIMLLFEK